MNSLMPLVRGYLESAGFNIIRQEGDFVVADKLLFGQDRDTWLVWTVPAMPSIRSFSEYEGSLRASLPRLRENYPDAKAYVLSASRSGFSKDILQTLAELRIKFLVPIQFFDASFKVEEAPKAASAIASIRSLASTQRRVPQPFRVEAENGDGEDLFGALTTEVARPSDGAVRFVVGRAGIGKSFLFRVAFSQLYDDFLDAKARHETRPRPIPLLPDHLKGTYALRTEALIENFLRTDVASPVGRETFEWLLVNGFAVWLLDGLDELYAGDPNFFDYLLDLVTRKNSRAQITIFCRDSLLTTSEPFADFRDLAGGTKSLKIYKLAEWERPSKRRFAWLGLEGRLPKSDEQDTGRVGSFLKEIDRAATLQTLSRLPFYCELLLQQFRDGHLQDFGDEVTMLNHVVDQMVAREVSKGLLDLRLFVPDGLQEWLEQLAAGYVEGQRYADISRDDAMMYGELVLRDGLDQQTRSHILTSLVQFPLFRAGSETGLIGFTHDLIAEALAARAYLRAVLRQPAEVARRLSRIDLEDPSLLRFMARRLGPDEEARVVEELQRGGITGRGFAVFASLLMLARPERDLLKRISASLEGQDLVAIRFEKRDLSSLSFRHSDLSHAVFHSCDLRGAQFEGAFLSRTRFEADNQLQDAHFGDLSRVNSLLVGKRLLEEPAQIRKWIAESTGRPEAPGEPCATALQMAHLFGKFITPLGEPKRHDLGHDALLAGKHYSGAAEAKACVEEAAREGYLTGPDFRGRYRRAEGDKYGEIVRFVRDGSVSDALGGLIRRLCPSRGCLHQLRP